VEPEPASVDSTGEDVHRAELLNSTGLAPPFVFFFRLPTQRVVPTGMGTCAVVQTGPQGLGSSSLYTFIVVVVRSTPHF
jgi:hypothetical protein